MYFFEGSEACLNAIPALAVMSSSCGTTRPKHLVALAPGGGGGGVGCPPCAAAMSAPSNTTRIVFASRLHRNGFNDLPLALDLMDSGLAEWPRDRAHGASLSTLCRSPAPGPHRPHAIPSGRRPAIDSACGRSGGSGA